MKTNSRVNEIDLLRFFAAFAVVFFHYSFRGYAADSMSIMPYPLLAPYSKYGYLGVHLFFIISGFVILMTAAKGGVRSFFVSRVVRLYPAFWTCCTVTFVVTVIIGGSSYSASFGQYFVNMTMLSEFFNVKSIDDVYWSLFVEIKFYIFIVILLTIGKINKIQSILIFWILISIILEIFPVYKIKYLLIANWSTYFIAGSIFFLIWSNGASMTRIALVGVSWILAMVQLTRGVARFERHYNTDLDTVIVCGIVTLFYLAMFLISFRKTGFVGRCRWVFVGSLTYPLYLIHQNIGFMIFNRMYPGVDPHILFWTVIFGAIAAAFCVHHFIEKKFALPMKNALDALLDSVQRSLLIYKNK